MLNHNNSSKNKNNFKFLIILLDIIIIILLIIISYLLITNKQTQVIEKSTTKASSTQSIKPSLPTSKMGIPMGKYIVGVDINPGSYDIKVTQTKSGYGAFDATVTRDGKSLLKEEMIWNKEYSFHISLKNKDIVDLQPVGDVNYKVDFIPSK